MAVPSNLPPLQELAEDNEPRPGSRTWIWILLSLVILFLLPGFLVGLLHRQRDRRFALSMPTVAESKMRIVPEWVPMRPDFRIEKPAANSGPAIVHSADSIAPLIDFYDVSLRQKGFQVSTNLMERDDGVDTAMLNASDRRGRSVLVTARKTEVGTRVEVSFSERSSR